MIEIDRIYNEDCLQTMSRMPDDFVDLTVTSPPYDNLRKYNGYCFDFENVAKELYRVTKPGGVVIWVVGDATIKGCETGSSFRQALYFMECGFRLHDTMIYRKNNPIPQNHNRYEQCFEYMFCLSKGKPKTFNPIMVKTIHGGEDMNWGGRKTLMDDAQCRRHRSNETRKVKKTKRHENIFNYSVGGEQTGHPAVFPKLLAHDQIVSWSDVGGGNLRPISRKRNYRNSVCAPESPLYRQRNQQGVFRQSPATYQQRDRDATNIILRIKS